MIESWRAQAKCRGMDPNFFFPERHDTKQINKARQFCLDCPVKQECMDYASENAIDSGIWGGEGSKAIRRNRRRLGLALQRPTVIQHGTYTGYQQHHKRHETPCFDCKQARRVYQVELQAKRG